MNKTVVPVTISGSRGVRHWIITEVKAGGLIGPGMGKTVWNEL